MKGEIVTVTTSKKGNVWVQIMITPGEGESIPAVGEVYDIELNEKATQESKNDKENKRKN